MIHLKKRPRKWGSKFENYFWASCYRKIQYKTKGRAWYEAGLLNKFGQDFGNGKAEAYKCAFGKHYHIGHRSRCLMTREQLRDLTANQFERLFVLAYIILQANQPRE